MFDLESLTHKEKPLADLVTAGSIDNEKGEPQTNIILLKALKAWVLSPNPRSTDACLDWMKTHTLPEPMHDYAITSVMPDPSTAETGIEHSAAGLNYQTLRTSYYSYLETSGMMLNDSQISLDRSPAQKPFRSTLLALGEGQSFSPNDPDANSG